MTAYAERRDIIADRNTDGTVALQRVKDQPQIVDIAGYLIGLIQAVRSILGKIASGFARLSQLRPTVDPLRPVIAVKNQSSAYVYAPPASVNAEINDSNRSSSV